MRPEPSAGEDLSYLDPVWKNIIKQHINKKCNLPTTQEEKPKTMIIAPNPTLNNAVRNKVNLEPFITNQEAQLELKRMKINELEFLREMIKPLYSQLYHRTPNPDGKIGMNLFKDFMDKIGEPGKTLGFHENFINFYLDSNVAHLQVFPKHATLKESNIEALKKNITDIFVAKKNIESGSTATKTFQLLSQIRKKLVEKLV